MSVAKLLSLALGVAVCIAAWAPLQYSVVPASTVPAVFVVNRLTGEVAFCSAASCKQLGAPPVALPVPAISSYLIGPTTTPGTISFDLEGARKSGHSLSEIVDHLAVRAGFDIESARRDGVTNAAVLNFLLHGRTN